MSEICIINGSPRKNFNTAKMCEAFSNGAKSASNDVIVKTYYLYDYNFKGCYSCLGCKLKDSTNYGKCIKKDDITDILTEVSSADGIVFASPIYFMDISGEMKSFIERLLFPFLTYEKGFRSIAPKKLKTATIYTMNVREEGFSHSHLDTIEWYITHVFSKPIRICAYNTCQVKDYNLYKMDVFNAEDKENYRIKHWENDLKKAFEAGKMMIESL